MTNQQPLISVIMPAYNTSRYIGQSIQAIQAQTYPHWELFVIDDCSQDNTFSIVQSLAQQDNRITLLRTERNSGSGIARNMGIRMAKGRYIAFCDSDDCWLPTKLEEQLHFMQENGYEFTVTWYQDCDESLRPYYTVKQPDQQIFNDLIAGCVVGTSEVMYDTQRIGKVFMPDFRRSQDWVLWLRILQKVDCLYVYPHVLSLYRANRGVSRNKLAMVKAAIRVYHRELGYSYLKAYWIFMTQFLPKNIYKKLRKI